MQLSEWAGLIGGRTDDFDGLEVRTFSAPSGGSWSGPFKVIATDGEEYFVKSLETCPPGGGASLAIEMIVARMGLLIGAPMCVTSLIRIPDALAGWEAKPGVPLGKGLAHASRALLHCDEAGRPNLAARAQDDNARRHVGIYAVYDWCMGHDQQWLYDIDADRRIYSHDHGLYLPPVGQGTVTLQDLIAAAPNPHVLTDAPGGLVPAEITAVSQALLSVDRSSLAVVLNTVPASWPVSDEVLEAVGWFLEERAPGVAERLEALV